MLALALGGCRADVEIRVDVDASAIGSVRAVVELDSAAAEVAGDLTEWVRADDLRRAGWVVVTGIDRVTATRRVNSAQDLSAAFAELSGPGGPFAGLVLSREASFARTKVELSGTVDLSDGLAAFGDEALRALTGSATGVDLDPDAVSATLEVNLPGSEDTNAPEAGPRWPLPLGELTEVRAESTDTNVIGFAAGALAVACALSLMAVGISRARS